MTSVKLHLIIEYEYTTKKAEDNLCSSVMRKMIVIFRIHSKSAHIFSIL